MRALLLLGLALVAPFLGTLDAQDAKEKDLPTKAEIKAMVAELKTAWKSKDNTAKVAAITKAKDVVDAAVIKEVTKGLKDKELPVVDATVDALRWMDHPQSVKSLTKHWKKDKELRKDAERAPDFLKAIGQHGDLSTLTVFTDNPFENTANKAIQARILSIGRIRSPKSVAALMEMMQKSGGGGRGGRGGRGGGNQGGGRHMNYFRTALTVLTGTDLGSDRTAWKKWWDKNEKGYKVAKEMPELPRDVERTWNAFWGTMEENDRGTEREDRGRGPEGN